MNLALLCLLIACLMPFVWTGIAKFSGPRYNNRNPRVWQSRLDGLPQRAHAAHLNSFEALPIFAAAVLAALHTGLDPQLVDRLAIAFVALRSGYGLAYLADVHWLRSLLWVGGLGCCVALLLYAASA